MLMSPSTRLLLLILVFSLSERAAAAKETSKDDNDDDKCPCQILPRPRPFDKPKTARWMAHSLDWGVLSTISSRLQKDNNSPCIPFGNPYSFVDGPCDNSTGTPYFYGTYMDQTFADTIKHPNVSLTLSEASLSSVCGTSDTLKACRISSYGDPENPVCARLVLTGMFEIVTLDTHEYLVAKHALFQRHPAMKEWPDDHEWLVAKLNVQDVWLVDFYGGATIIPVKAYMSVDLFCEEQDSDSNEPVLYGPSNAGKEHCAW